MVCLCYSLVARKLIDDRIDYTLCGRRKIAVHFLAGVILQTLGKLSDEQFEFRIFQITILHLLNQGIHDLQSVFL